MSQVVRFIGKIVLVLLIASAMYVAATSYFGGNSLAVASGVGIISFVLLYVLIWPLKLPNDSGDSN